MKKVIAACIDRLYEFDTSEELKAHIEKLRAMKKNFLIISQSEVQGKFLLRIQEQYNSSPMFGD